MNNRSRLALASLAAATAAAAGYPLVLLVIGAIVEPKGLTKSGTVQLGLIIFGCAFLVAAAHIILLGIPAVLVLQRLNKLRFSTMAAAGFLIGSIPVAFYNVQLSPWAGLLGMIGASAFWAVWSRPSQPPPTAVE